jgi:predicted Rossmann-fold nucleotide-binding protein
MIDIPDSPVRDLWRIFRVMAEFTEGFEELASVGPAVSIFGSARARPDERYYKLAEETAFELAKGGFAIITGGGGGIMEAANKGAADAGGQSIGLNIELPLEQIPN